MEPPVGTSTNRYKLSVRVEAFDAEEDKTIASQNSPRDAIFLKRSKASGDLSNELEASLTVSKRQSSTVSYLLDLLRAHSYPEAVQAYHSLTLRHFKETAFNSIVLHLLEAQQIPVHLRELVKDLPQASRNERLFNLASDYISRTGTLVTRLQLKRSLELSGNENAYRIAFNETHSMLAKAIKNILNIYKEIENDNLRCALIIRVYTNLFLFPVHPLPAFPIEAILANGIRDKETLNKLRQEYQEKIKGIDKLYQDFENETIKKTKDDVEFELLQFHLKENLMVSLVYIFKYICTPADCAKYFLAGALQLIREKKIEPLPALMAGVVSVKDHYVPEARSNVEEMIVQATVLAMQQNRADLAERFLPLVPHRSNEIMSHLGRE